MTVKSILGALSVVSILSACASGEPLAPGEKNILIGIPKASNCRMDGPNVTMEQNENFFGKDIKARGDLDQSVLVCTNGAGQVLQTTDHRGLLRGALSANVILYSVKPGVNRASGSQTIRSQQYEFWADFNFVPAT